MGNFIKMVYGELGERGKGLKPDEAVKLWEKLQGETKTADEAAQVEDVKKALTKQEESGALSETFEKADEFRYIERHEDKKMQGHPAHIYAKSNDRAKYLQMTHSQFIKDMAEANISLKANPNPSDKRTAYVVPKSHISNLDDLGKVRKGWKLSEIDNDTLIIYRDEPFNK